LRGRGEGFNLLMSGRPRPLFQSERRPRV